VGILRAVTLISTHRAGVHCLGTGVLAWQSGVLEAQLAAVAVVLAAPLVAERKPPGEQAAGAGAAG
jgi:hypothetical protein